MFKWFKKKEKNTPKYLIHIIGTREFEFVQDDETLENILNIYGKDNVDVTDWHQCLKNI